MKQIGLFIVILICLMSCNKIGYKNFVLQRLDLRGNAKSLSTNINFENTIFDYCDKNLNQIINSEFKHIKFSKTGFIQSVVCNNLIETYDKNGNIISKSFKNKKGIEYGYSNFRYFKNQYHNLNYDIDSSRLFLDTFYVIEKGTRNKYQTGFTADLEYGIEIKYIINKNGYLLEKMYKNIEGGLEKYLYDEKNKLKAKIRIYDEMIMDSIIFKYDKNGYLSNIINKPFKTNNSFEFKNFDSFGNWTELYIKNKSKQIEIKRKIEYY